LQAGSRMCSSSVPTATSCGREPATWAPERYRWVATSVSSRCGHRSGRATRRPRVFRHRALGSTGSRVPCVHGTAGSRSSVGRGIQRVRRR
jgi:hypothetical protein